MASGEQDIIDFTDDNTEVDLNGKNLKGGDLGSVALARRLIARMSSTSNDTLGEHGQDLLALAQRGDRLFLLRSVQAWTALSCEKAVFKVNNQRYRDWILQKHKTQSTSVFEASEAVRSILDGLEKLEMVMEDMDVSETDLRTTHITASNFLHNTSEYCVEAIMKSAVKARHTNAVMVGEKKAEKTMFKGRPGEIRGEQAVVEGWGEKLRPSKILVADPRINAPGSDQDIDKYPISPPEKPPGNRVLDSSPKFDTQVWRAGTISNPKATKLDLQPQIKVEDPETSDDICEQMIDSLIPSASQPESLPIRKRATEEYDETHL